MREEALPGRAQEVALHGARPAVRVESRDQSELGEELAQRALLAPRHRHVVRGEREARHGVLAARGRAAERVFELEHTDAAHARAGEPPRGGEPRDPGADDEHGRVLAAPGRRAERGVAQPVSARRIGSHEAAANPRTAARGRARDERRERGEPGGAEHAPPADARAVQFHRRHSSS